MARSIIRSAAGATAVVGLVLVSGCQPGTSEQDSGPDWSAITDQEWPPGDPPEDQRLDDNPQRTNIAVVLDMSGSMRETNCSGDHPSKAHAALDALATWTDAVPRDANIGLISFFNSQVNTLVPLGTDNRDRFIEAARAIRPGGGTPLRSSMETAHELLMERAHYQLGYGRYQIVTITDGAHTAGENPVSVVDEIIGNPANPVEIHTIGFCIDDSALKQPGIVDYQSAHDPEQLASGLSNVLAESSDFEPMEDFDEN